MTLARGAPWGASGSIGMRDDDGMTAYPHTRDDRRISGERLQSLVRAIFERCGMRAEDASLVSETLVAADWRGCHSHGVLRVPEYVSKLRTGGVDPRGEPRLIRETGGALVIDGGNSMGQVASVFAMRKAIEKAHGAGTAFAAVRGSNHCGAMARYVMMALPADMIGIAATNALPTMAPFGGADKILGINPLAAAIPAAEEIPIVFDAAFSASSHGKIRVYHQKGLELPQGWAFDADGRPTTNAEAALTGMLQPIGGYKGTGLALIMGILSALLSGASYGAELGNMADGPRAGQDGHFFLALKIAAFTDAMAFKHRVDEIVRQIHACRPAPGFKAVYAPGEMEARTERIYRREGIPLNPATLEGLADTARQLGVDPTPALVNSVTTAD